MSRPPRSGIVTTTICAFVASFSLPTAIALYWIVTNAFIIIQNYLFEKSANKDSKKNEKKEKINKKVSIKEKSEKRRGN